MIYFACGLLLKVVSTEWSHEPRACVDSCCLMIITVVRLIGEICCGLIHVVVITGEDYVDSGSEISKLEHKLSDYRNIIGQQEEMLLQVRGVSILYP